MQLKKHIIILTAGICSFIILGGILFLRPNDEAQNAIVGETFDTNIDSKTKKTDQLKTEKTDHSKDEKIDQLKMMKTDQKSTSISQITSSPDATIGGKSINGSWAALSGIEGASYQEQLDNKIAYLEEVYQEKNEQFIVEEGVSLEEVNNSAGIEYLYDNSELYRLLVTVENDLMIAKDPMFSLSTADQTAIYIRYVFSLLDPADLNLTISYALETGKMAVWFISPEGEMLYQNELLSEFKDILKLELKEGLYSIILVYDLDDNCVEGEKEILGTFDYH